MNPTNHAPDQQHPEASMPPSILTVEWMPLDGIIQQWATAAIDLPHAEALQATSEALRALALETSARRCYGDTCTVRAWEPSSPELVKQHLALALTDLFEARRHWEAVAEWLERLARACRRERDCYSLLCALFTELYTHQGYISRLVARLAEESVPVTATMQQAMTHTLAEAFGVPEQEETA